LPLGLQGLRSPARFGIIVVAGVAVLAGLGCSALVERARSVDRRLGGVLVAVLLVVVMAESVTTGVPLAVVPAGSADVYRAVRGLGPGVVMELPAPLPDTLPGQEAVYAYWSTLHWNPLINGYSGYRPQVYLSTLNEMRAFPDDESIARLKRLNVRYVIVHRIFFGPGGYEALIERMRQRPELEFQGRFSDPMDQADLFVIGDAVARSSASPPGDRQWREPSRR
jgi:hypothetical protein